MISKFSCGDEAEVKLLRAISEKGSGLNVLSIAIPSHLDPPQLIPGGALAVEDPNLFPQFDSALERLFQRNPQGLKKLKFLCPYPLVQLSLPPFCNLSEFSIASSTERQLDILWNVIASINFERDMPILKEVEICPNDRRWVHQQVARTAWPDARVENLVHFSSTVRKLTLSTRSAREIDLRPLQTLFPDILELDLRIESRRCSKSKKLTRT